jgi:hypothetical protein
MGELSQKFGENSAECSTKAFDRKVRKGFAKVAKKSNFSFQLCGEKVRCWAADATAGSSTAFGRSE